MNIGAGNFIELGEHDNCVIIGDNLKATQDYHLIIEGVCDQVMTPEEHKLINAAVAVTKQKCEAYYGNLLYQAKTLSSYSGTPRNER
ncbi:MAG: hypothetical protein JKY22_12155 [Flavobacteriaceae bacterium]|nr:hypothetical protein [Flavobacteriaceae bacterium]PCJ26501.1 MAG: hypothetical protein COA94_05170 [Rickettsiales bacterium]